MALPIENPKIASLLPGADLFRRWIPTQVWGVSELFDPPCGFGIRDGFPVLDCDLDDPKVGLYARLANSVPDLERILSDLRLCWLDPPTYHTTFANSVNIFNLHSIRSADIRAEYEEFLQRLPQSGAGRLPAGLPPLRVTTNAPWKVRLQFKGLHVWPEAFALVALLEPDDASKATLEALKLERPAVNAQLVRMGMTAESGPALHVSLGYTTSKEQAIEVMKVLEECNKALPATLQDCTVEHSSISLYGWTSMVDFWPIVRTRKWRDAEAYQGQSELIEAALNQSDHSLDSLLHWMRSCAKPAIWLFGGRVDNDFCFGSKEVGMLLSVLPEDAHAGVPGYHPGSTETYVTLEGSLVMDCLEGGNLVHHTVAGNDVLVIPPGTCHRVRAPQNSRSSSMIVKTNLKSEPGVVRCNNCGYFTDPTVCPLNRAWRAEEAHDATI